MAVQFSWDLHVHPGPSSVPRWESGVEIQAAARRAGLTGFVWKSHDRHTARGCRELPPGTPWAIGSASLNEWAFPADVMTAIEEGARWVWGSTHDHGQVSWELPLPAGWPSVAGLLRQTQQPLVLGTGHLGPDGRRAMAELASHLRCSITHSLYVPPTEVTALRNLGCVFEVDLYTGTRAIEGRPLVDLDAGIQTLRKLGALVYLTSDAGQVEVGDPYLFSAATLGTLADKLGADVLQELAARNPNEIAVRATEGLLA